MRSFSHYFCAVIPLAVCAYAKLQANDSVPGLNRSVAELPAASSTLDLPAGSYTVASTWDIAKSGVTIRGAGIGKTVLIRDPQFNGVLVRIDGASSTITGLTLDGNGTATVISLNGRGVVADTIEVKNFTHIGIAVPASDCRVTKCIVTGLGNPVIPSIGIWHDAGRNSSGSTIMIDHSVINDNGINGIYCTGGKVTLADNRLSRNHCATNPGGGQIDVGNAFTANTVANITGNSVLNGGGIKTGGIEMGGGKFTVTNNTIRYHGLGGIGVGHNAIKATITGNTISDSGQNIADTNKPQCRSGIYVMYGASNVEISGNRCFDDQPNKTQTWGVLFVPPPARPDPRFLSRATEHIVVKGNDLRGNLHKEGLLDQSRARDRVIAGNLPADANR